MKKEVAKLFGPTTNAIVLFGHARGGTNILWNAIGSHRNVLMTNNELNELFGANVITRLIRKCPYFLIIPFCKKALQKVILSSVLRALNSPVLDEISPGVCYQREDFGECQICYKGVNLDTGCINAIKYLHGEIKPVILGRDPVVVILGHIRRGWTFQKSVICYIETLSGLRKIISSYSNSYFLNFSDLIKNPRVELSKIYHFLGLEVEEPMYIRFKAKRKTAVSGNNVAEGYLEHNHYWMTEDEYIPFLDKDIDGRREDDLSKLSLISKYSKKEINSAIKMFVELNEASSSTMK